jgi:copper chaperone
MATSTYTVTGMTCGHCVAAVQQEIGKIEGVTDIAIDLPTGRVQVESVAPLPEGAVHAAVDEAGYEMVNA